MKKKLLATALALVMLLSLLPSAAFAADRTVTTEAELKDAIAQAQDGDTITLGADIEIDPTYAIDKGYTAENNGPLDSCMTIESDITLNLNGYKISWDLDKISGENDAPSADDILYTVCFFEVKGAAVTVEGNGTIDTEFNMSNSYGATITSNGSVTINNGMYTGATTAFQVEEGTLTVFGGTFTQAETIGSVAQNLAKYVINCIDSNYKAGTAKIELKGGTYCYDFSNNPEGTGTSYVAEGYISLANDDGTYRVEELNASNATAEVGGNYYETLAEAISDATDNQTVTLLKDCTVSSAITIDKDLTLDLNGYVISNGVTDSYLFHVSADFTVDGTESGSGMEIPEANTEARGFIQITETAALNLLGGIYTGIPQSRDDPLFLLSADESLAYNSGANGSTVNLENLTVNTSCRVFNMDTLDTITLNVTGGSYTSTAETNNNTEKYNVFGMDCIDVPDSTNLNFNKVTITSAGGACVEVCGGAAIFTDCDFTVENPSNPSFTATAVATSYQGSATIVSGTYDSQGYGIYVYSSGGSINMQGGIVAGSEAAVKADNDSINNIGSHVSITGGNVNGAISIESSEGSNASLTISGGYFTSDPSAYVAEGKAALSSDTDGYTFMVGDEIVSEAGVVPAAGTPVVDMSQIDEEDKNNVQTAAESVSDNGALSAAANAVLNEVTEQQKDAAEDAIQASDSGVTVGNDDTVTVYVQTYLDIQPTAYSTTEGEESLTLDITPMYRVVASTAASAEGIKVVDEVESGETPNAVVLENSAQPLDNIQTMTISITLPSGFANSTDPLYVKHVKDNGRTYYYTGTVTTDNAERVLTFTNPNGFSEFTIMANNGAQAEIDGVGYDTLTNALADAEDGDTVKVLQNNLSATMSGSTRTITLENGVTGQEITVTINGDERSIASGESIPYTYTRPSSPVTPTPEPEPEELPFTDVAEEQWFYDAVKYVYDAELMNGVTETTFEPDSNLTRGMLATILYRMAGMPAITGEGNAFTDVAAGSWYADAIDWAAENGIVEGYGDGTFFPDNDITREQMATILYRYAQYMDVDVSVGEDTNILSYADFDEISEYAIPALQWACGAGVITGVTEDTLVPQGTATRAQVSTILMRYCETVAK